MKHNKIRKGFGSTRSVLIVIFACSLGLAQINIWQQATVTPATDGIAHIVVDLDSTQYVYAAAISGKIYYSHNGGEYWQPCNNAGLTATWVNDAAIHPTTSGTLYAVGLVDGETFCRLYKSSDRGSNWDVLNSFDGIWDTPTIEICLDDPLKISCANSNKLYLSNNGGVTWADTFTTPSVWPLEQQPIYRPGAPDTIYTGLGDADPYGIYVSLNGGNSFIPDTAFKWPANWLAIDPYNRDRVGVACANNGVDYGGLRWSLDAGITWPSSQTWDTTLTVSSVVFNPQRKGMLWIAVADANYIYVSTDSGSTFSPMNTGLTPGSEIGCLAVYAPDTLQYMLYAGTNPGTANAEIWFYQGDLGNYDAGVVSIDMPSTVPPDTTLSPQATVTNYGSYPESFDVACTITPGAYSSTYTVVDLAASGSTQVTFPDQFTFLSGSSYTVTVYTQLSPDYNQANDTLETIITVSGIGEGSYGQPTRFQFNAPLISHGQIAIELNLPEQTDVDLSVYGVNGQLCDKLIAGQLEPGNHTLNTDLNLSSGVYFLKLETASGFNETKKLLFVR